MRPSLDIDAVTAQRPPVFLGLQFDSKPAALRQLLMVQEIIESTPADSGTLGLDVGSKFAHLSNILGAYGIRTIRVDIERRKSDDEFVLADAQKMPFREGSLDFVVLSNVLTHVDDVDMLLSEARRVVKPGGTLFILQSNRFGWWRFWVRYLRRIDHRVHRRAFDVWSIRSTLARHHFEIAKMYSPYYFYLHSKLSDLFYRLDRSLGSRVPNLFATQWIILASRAPDTDGPISSPRPPGRMVTGLVIAVAVLQSLTVKAMELGLRAWYRPRWGGEEI